LHVSPYLPWEAWEVPQVAEAVIAVVAVAAAVAVAILHLHLFQYYVIRAMAEVAQLAMDVLAAEPLIQAREE
jgi:hypothetical protein